MKLRLIEIAADGRPVRCTGETPAAARDVLEGTLHLYAETGFTPPWVSYLADRDGELVGACAFLGPPREGAVEIAGQTFPGHERLGIGREMARQLIRLAREQNPALTMRAQGPAEEGPAARLLRGLGFVPAEPVEDGRWCWRLAPETAV